MTSLVGRTALVTGGTDGIGAATALELRRRGADVVAIGRSPAKAVEVGRRGAALDGPGSLTMMTADLGLMREVRSTVDRVVEDHPRVDLLVQAAGVLLTRTEHTREGVEKDFAVGYLGRYELLEHSHRAGAIGPWTRVVTIAASAPTVPRVARVEFDDVDAVAARVGMRSHGQAQLANDLLTARAAARYGVTAIGYGPGSVRTSIRREVPAVLRWALAPFFRASTRDPADVARQIVDLLESPEIASGSTTFAGRQGAFVPDDFVTDPQRQSDLLRVSRALVDRALEQPSY